MSQHSSLQLLAAVAIVTAIVAATAVPAAAASPGVAPAAQDQARATPAMRALGDQVAAAPVVGLQPFRPASGLARPNGASPAHPRREVFGFADGANLETSNGIHSWNFSLLSTVAFFGLHVNAADGTFAQDGGWNHWNSADLTDLLNTAHGNGVSVVLTIIYQDTGSGMCTALEHRTQTAISTVQQILAKGVDGVNVDYEGYNAACGPTNNRALVTALVYEIRQRMVSQNVPTAQRYITVDTYASSAADSGGFFDIPNLGTWSDAFFVMAYALEMSNSGTSVCSTCLGPTSPLTGYHWNDTDTASQYAAVAGPTKTILGLPYYGVKGCVTSPPASTPANAQIVGGFSSGGTYAAESYLGIAADIRDPNLQPMYLHRDQVDGPGQEMRADFYSPPTYANCNRQMYWDDATSLSAKYDLVNRDNLRGAGLWTLNYGGGAPELWNQLATHFALIPGTPTGLTTCPAKGSAGLSWTPPASASPITSYTIRANPGPVTATVPGNAYYTSLDGLSDGTAYSFTVTASDAYGAGPTSAASGATTPAPALGAWPGRLHALTPTRILDTRNSTGGHPGQLGPGQTLVLSVVGQGSVPSTGVTAVSLNITETNPSQAGYLTVYPNGTCRPTTSNLNFGPWQTAANLVQASLGGDGKVAIYNAGSAGVDVIADVSAWFGASADTGAEGHYHAVTPDRVLDTRGSIGGHNGQLGPGQTLTLQVNGPGPLSSVPASQISAVALNLTTTNGSSQSYLAVTPTPPSGAPAVSNLNFMPWQTVANRVIVPVNAAGQVTVYNSQGWTDVIVDAAGWFSSASTVVSPTGTYTALPPIRLVDTRYGLGAPAAPLGAGQVITVPVAGHLGVPGSGATAVVINLTAVAPTSQSYLAVTPAAPAGAPRTSDVSFMAGQNVPNLVVATVGSDGAISVYNSQGSADVLVDILGWYS